MRFLNIGMKLLSASTLSFICLSLGNLTHNRSVLSPLGSTRNIAPILLSILGISLKLLFAIVNTVLSCYLCQFFIEKYYEKLSINIHYKPLPLKYIETFMLHTRLSPALSLPDLLINYPLKPLYFPE